MIGARLRARALALMLAVLAAGCAQLPRVPVSADPQSGPWSGRLALNVPEQPQQSFSAAFELRGTAQAGALTLLTPLGGVAAQLDWEPGSARLRANGQAQQFDSVDALVAHATGSAIPVAALFDWLRGTPTPVPGWEPDLSGLAEGRVRARRGAPPPAADLRVVLDR